jgi:hypothetical protein
MIAKFISNNSFVALAAIMENCDPNSFKGVTMTEIPYLMKRTGIQ